MILHGTRVLFVTTATLSIFLVVASSLLQIGLLLLSLAYLVLYAHQSRRLKFSSAATLQMPVRAKKLVAVLAQAIPFDRCALSSNGTLSTYGTKRATLSVPLIHSREIRGVLTFYAKDEEFFNETHLRFARAVAPTLARLLTD